MLQHELNVINNTIEKAAALSLTRLVNWATGVRDAIQKEIDAEAAAEAKANAVLANIPPAPVTLAPSAPVSVQGTPAADTPAAVSDGSVGGLTLAQPAISNDEAGAPSGLPAASEPVDPETLPNGLE